MMEQFLDSKKHLEAPNEENQLLITDAGIFDQKRRKHFFKSRLKLSCDFCEYVCFNLKILNNHLITEHSTLIFCCKVCNRYLPHSKLMPHMTAHAYQQLPHKQTKAGYNTELESDPLDQEEAENNKCNISSKLKTLVCEKCKSTFSTKRVLDNHIRSIHGRGKRNYACDKCNKSFKTDSTLYTHQKVHKQKKSFQCDLCNKRFRYKHHWKSHVEKHKYTNTAPDELPFECSCCHKKFMGKDNLRKHIKIHDIIMNDFICHICKVKFKQKRYLRQHMTKVHLQSLKNDS